MTQQTTPPEGGAQDTPPAATTPEQRAAQTIAPELQKLVDGIIADPTRAAEEMKRLRAESKERRKTAEQAEHARQTAEQTRLESAKEFETLSRTQKQQIDEWSPKIERLDAIEQFVLDLAQKRIAALSKQWQTAVPQFEDPLKTLEWLETNASLFPTPVVPDLSPGAQGEGGRGSPTTARLTPEELALAQQAGMTPKQFAEYKARWKPADAK